MKKNSIFITPFWTKLDGIFRYLPSWWCRIVFKLIGYCFIKSPSFSFIDVKSVLLYSRNQYLCQTFPICVNHSFHGFPIFVHKAMKSSKTMGRAPTPHKAAHSLKSKKALSAVPQKRLSKFKDSNSNVFNGTIFGQNSEKIWSGFGISAIKTVHEECSCYCVFVVFALHIVWHSLP